MVTLTYRHFGNPGRSHHRARYAIVHKKSMTRAFLLFLVRKFTSNARDCKSSGRGARRLAAGQ